MTCSQKQCFRHQPVSHAAPSHQQHGAYTLETFTALKLNYWSCLCYCQNNPAGDPRGPRGRPGARGYHVGDPSLNTQLALELMSAMYLKCVLLTYRWCTKEIFINVSCSKAIGCLGKSPQRFASLYEYKRKLLFTKSRYCRCASSSSSHINFLHEAAYTFSSAALYCHEISLYRHASRGGMCVCVSLCFVYSDHKIHVSLSSLFRKASRLMSPSTQHYGRQIGKTNKLFPAFKR